MCGLTGFFRPGGFPAEEGAAVAEAMARRIAHRGPDDAGVWVDAPAGIALALFVWLLTLHPAASGRVYAAYGGVYVCTALLWLRVVDGVKLSAYDWAGALIALCGMLIIVAGWGRA